MNKNLLATALALVAVPAAAYSQTAHSMSASNGMVTVKINGLVCDFCVQALTRTFRKEKAVDGFHVDLKAKEIHMTFKPGLSIDDARIRKLVADAGYDVVGIARAKA